VAADRAAPSLRLVGLGSNAAVDEAAERTYASVEQAIADVGLECRPGRLVASHAERCAPALGAKEGPRSDIAER